LAIIFSQFGKVRKCEVVKDSATGDSLQYGFVEFETREACEEAFFKMENVLVDNCRIHVDFSQSVTGLWNRHTRARQRKLELYKDIRDGREDGQQFRERERRREEQRQEVRLRPKFNEWREESRTGDREGRGGRDRPEGRDSDDDHRWDGRRTCPYRSERFNDRGRRPSEDDPQTSGQGEDHAHRKRKH